MSSSMRNSIQRRSHRERAQPLERKRLGLLEKHKDYQLRARDWAQKKATLQKLRDKAAERNEDEFSYKMLSRQGPGSALMRGSDERRARSWDGTALGKRQGKTLSVETLRLLKTQDAGYIRAMCTVAAKEVRQLEQRAAVAKSFVGDVAEIEDEEDEEEDEEEVKVLTKAQRREKVRAKMTGTKIVFAETAADRDAILAEVPDKKADKDDDETQRKAEAAARLQRRLAAARKRLQALVAAEEELGLQRARIAKTPISVMQTASGQRTKIRARKR